MNQGFIKIVVIVLLGIIVLSLLDFDLRSIVDHPKVKSNFLYVLNGIKSVWNNYIEKPINFLWGVFYNNLWLKFVDKVK